MLLGDFVRGCREDLGRVYDADEARAIVSRLCEEVLGVSSWAHVIEPGLQVAEDKVGVLEEARGRLAAGEPLQYVLGYADFCGYRFRVTRDVLIPRPETEEVVRVAVAFAGERGVGPAGLDVLDLCTGSGCIAWSIALMVPGARVTGVDISEAALAVAASQAPTASQVQAAQAASQAPTASQAPAASATSQIPTTLDARGGTSQCAFPGGERAAEAGQYSFPGGERAAEAGQCAFPGGERGTSTIAFPEGGRLSFIRCDVLRGGEGLPGEYDVIVSNPPYVRESERVLMHRNVLEHEPALALFVPDDDALKFYRAIARIARDRLRPGGMGMVEINEALGEETAGIFADVGMDDIRIVQDFRAKIRFISFRKRPLE